MIKLNLNNLSRYYLINFFMLLTVLLSISVMFYVQFKVKNLQNKADEADSTIISYEDEIKVLEVEWVYLTRPERLRELNQKYLQNNSYIASNQVKDDAKMEKYYIANLEKAQSKQMAMQENSSSEVSKIISN